MIPAGPPNAFIEAKQLLSLIPLHLNALPEKPNSLKTPPGLPFPSQPPPYRIARTANGSHASRSPPPRRAAEGERSRGPPPLLSRVSTPSHVRFRYRSLHALRRPPNSKGFRGRLMLFQPFQRFCFSSFW